MNSSEIRAREFLLSSGGVTPPTPEEVENCARELLETYYGGSQVVYEIDRQAMASALLVFLAGRADELEKLAGGVDNS